MTPQPNAYDRLLYAGGSFPQTHPARLATVAALFGLRSPPPDRCRVLELGCGTGFNLIAIASSMPDAEFVGVDLAQTPIDLGRARIERLGLHNVRLQQDDVSRIDARLGRFDYVIAHGLYAWVPASVRPHVMRVFGELLSDTGVAYVSYNAMPGCHLRHMVRELLQLHFRTTTFEPSQIGDVRAFLAEVARIQPARDGEFMDALRREIEFVTSLPDHVLYHDDLAADSHAFLLSDVVGEATAHGLQYLGEAGISEMFTLPGFQGFDRMLADWSRGDRVAHEQHLDYVRGRRFRQTLLCRAEHTLGPAGGAPLLRTMVLRSPLLAEADASLYDRSEAKFSFPPRGATLDEPIAKVALAMLGERYPDAMSFDALLDAALGACAAHGVAYDARDAGDSLAALCWSMLRADLVEPFRDPIAPVVEPGASPRLRPIVADALRHGLMPTDPTGHAFRLDDDTAQRIALAMDGEHDRDALHAVSASLDDSVAPDVAAARLDGLLRFLKRHGAFAG